MKITNLLFIVLCVYTSSTAQIIANYSTTSTNSISLNRIPNYTGSQQDFDILSESIDDMTTEKNERSLITSIIQITNSKFNVTDLIASLKPTQSNLDFWNNICLQARQLQIPINRRLCRNIIYNIQENL